MADAEEDSLGKREENGEREMAEEGEEEEEEYTPDYKEVENAQQKPEGDTLAGSDQGGQGEKREEDGEVEEEKGAKEEEGEKEEEKGEEEDQEKDEEEGEKKEGGEREEGEGQKEEEREEGEKKEGGKEEPLRRGSASQQSLQSEGSRGTELSGSLSSRQDLDSDRGSGSEDNQGSSSQRPSSGGLLGTRQLSHSAGEAGRGPESGERVSCFLDDGGRAPHARAEASGESLVSSSTGDVLFQKDVSTSVYPLTMTWSFGWNSTLPVFYIRDENQRVLLYVCAHTAVIYNVFQNTQHHLQGHPNVISCLCLSEDRRWIATADKGPDCLIIIWDSFTGIPVHTIFDSCPEGNGIGAIAITRDAKFLATISDAEVQKVCIWKWTLAAETPACTLELPTEYGVQHYIMFNPTNNKELVSNSKTQAIYYSWYEEKDILAHSAPLLTEKTFNKLVGKFSQSVFHLNLTQILSATMEGKLVVWDIHRPPPSSATFVGFPYIKPCKLVHLQKEGITVLTAVDGYIVTGDVRGNIKFYDRTLSIVNWYSHFKLSSIRTLSFSKSPAAPTEKSSFPPDCTLKGDAFVVRQVAKAGNFIIGTADATVYHLTTDGTRLEKLFVEPKDAICAISCHPYQPLIAIGSVCGMIKVWNYEEKRYLFSRVFEKGLGVQSLTYNPEGALLGAGFTEGTVCILDAMSLENQSPKPFKYSRTSVTHISFSHDSQYMATADVSFTVAVYMVFVRKGTRVWEYLARLRSHRKSIRSLLFGVHLDSNEPRLLSLGRDRLLDVSFTVAVYMVFVRKGTRVWEYLARLRSHRKSIRSLLFGVHLDSNEPRLLSLGRDRLLIEYNLRKSYRDHLEVLDIHWTDQGNYPTWMVWYPPLTKELFLLICNSGYKVKLFNSTTKMCRKTLLGPTYGSPIEQALVLPARTTADLQKRYLVFINRDKVGLQILPVDGNPHKTAAIVCHPSGVAGMALSYDGCYVFTAGGLDRSVVQWKINVSALEAAVSLGGEDLTPFYGLVSGGREGKFYRELEDYFYYSQLRSQGLSTMEARRVSEHICLSELPFVMRAIGFYPSEEKIDDMFNEIKFSEYVDTGNLIDKINLADFLKVYVNHRPPFGNTMKGIYRSFDVLGFTNSKGEKAIRREDFLRLLLTKGELMTEEEMTDCFATLFGLNPEGWKSEPTTASVKAPQASSLANASSAEPLLGKPTDLAGLLFCSCG
ncbi:WD repeat-containing protein 66 [Tupaia chinensis]|uniref:Cilia- and flagella-associated protein 251 n=1 Tax=Tupaia chinensis TaxID=246437 RepID=L9KSR2_TUPCH|nr:WD repeat-containing protein 66 [Tupaia chinensis]